MCTQSPQSLTSVGNEKTYEYIKYELHPIGLKLFIRKSLKTKL